MFHMFWLVNSYTRYVPRVTLHTWQAFTCLCPLTYLFKVGELLRPFLSPKLPFIVGELLHLFLSPELPFIVGELLHLFLSPDGLHLQ